jgi:hypothetical protein
MPGGAPRIKPRKYVFVSESQHIEVNSHSVWNDGELWRIVGIPKHVPTGLRFKVTLEQVPNDTPFDTEFEDEKTIESLKQKVSELTNLLNSVYKPPGII